MKKDLKMYKFDDASETLSSQILTEIATAKKCGIEYIVIGDLSKKTNGFKRGSILSNLVYQLNNIKSNTPIKIGIKNTYEDINFYKTILEKVPNLEFHFDMNNAQKYSSDTLASWNTFINEIN